MFSKKDGLHFILRKKRSLRFVSFFADSYLKAWFLLMFPLVLNVPVLLRAHVNRFCVCIINRHLCVYISYERSSVS